MADDTQFSLGLLKSQAVYVDVNPKFNNHDSPELLFNVKAVNSALANLLSTPIGTLGPIFNPRYGSLLYDLIQEPLDEETASRIRASLIQSIETWETRIKLNMSQVNVVPDLTIPGYQISLGYTILGINQTGFGNFTARR